MRTRKAVAPKLSEADLQAFGTQLLELDGWRALRTDPVSDRFRGKGFGEIGMTDYLYIRYLDGAKIDVTVYAQDPDRRYAVLKPPAAEVLWIEYKRGGRGQKALTKELHQRLWQAKERARGALVWCAGVDFPTTTEGFKQHYAASGLNRSIRDQRTRAKWHEKMRDFPDLTSHAPKP